MEYIINTKDNKKLDDYKTARDAVCEVIKKQNSSKK